MQSSSQQPKTISSEVNRLYLEAKGDARKLSMPLLACGQNNDEKMYRTLLPEIQTAFRQIPADKMTYKAWLSGRVLLAASGVDDRNTVVAVKKELETIINHPTVPIDEYLAWAIGYLAALDPETYQQYSQKMLEMIAAFSKTKDKTDPNHRINLLWAWVMALQAAANAKDHVTYTFIVKQMLEVMGKESIIVTGLLFYLKEAYPAWALRIVHLAAVKIGDVDTEAHLTSGIPRIPQGTDDWALAEVNKKLAETVPIGRDSDYFPLVIEKLRSLTKNQQRNSGITTWRNIVFTDRALGIRPGSLADFEPGKGNADERSRMAYTKLLTLSQTLTEENKKEIPTTDSELLVMQTAGPIATLAIQDREQQYRPPIHSILLVMLARTHSLEYDESKTRLMISSLVFFKYIIPDLMGKPGLMEYEDHWQDRITAQQNTINLLNHETKLDAPANANSGAAFFSQKTAAHTQRRNELKQEMIHNLNQYPNMPTLHLAYYLITLRDTYVLTLEETAKGIHYSLMLRVYDELCRKITYVLGKLNLDESKVYRALTGPLADALQPANFPAPLEGVVRDYCVGRRR